MRNRHGSPFEHGYFRFLIKAPLAVVREHHRHRAGHSYNEWSGRYSQIEAEFYVPDFVRAQVGKPGAYTFEPVDDETRETAREIIERNGTERVRRVRAAARDRRRQGGGAARLAAFDLHEVLLELQPAEPDRTSAPAEPLDAQYEIRQYAAAAEDFLAEHMPVTHAAFIANDRTAP